MRSILLPAFLTIVLLIVSFSILIPKPAKAAPIFFEDDFRGCPDGTSPPPGWTRSGSTTALLDECQNIQSFPNVVNGTLPGFGPREGDDSFRIRRSDFTCCPLGSHTASFTPVTGTIVNWGFAFRYANLGISPIGLSDACDRAFVLTLNEAFADGPGICADGDDVPNQNIDSLFTRDAQIGGWIDTGVNLVNNTWYRFRFVADRSANTYSTFLNETLIASGTRFSGASEDFNTLTITTRGGRIDQNSETEIFLDWFFVGDLDIDPIENQTVSVCTNAVEQTILDASTDATTDVFFGLDSPPPFLSIVPASGRLFWKALPPEGPPPLGTPFLIEVIANVSSGGDSEQFNVTFVDCDPLEWIRFFGPQWVIFLVVVGVIFFIVLTLWRGAKGRRRRR